jgi:glycosyltransferase involved in cell wall biosynthesis
MRVLHVSPLYWPSLGGGEQVVRVLSERMARDGHTVIVVTTDAASVERFWNKRAPRVEAGETALDGVRVLRLPVKPFPLGRLGLFVVRGLAIRVLDPLRQRRLVRAIGSWMPRVPDLEPALRSLPGAFDVVHGFNLSWESCLVKTYEVVQNWPAAYFTTPFMHTGEPGRTRVSRNYTMSHQVAALRGSQRVIVQTPTEARAIESLGVERARIVEVGVGIDPARLSGGDAERFRARHGLRRRIVAFIGRATRDKGATALVRAMQRVWATGVQAECVIAGQTLPDFERFMRTQPPDPRLLVLGPISDNDKHDLLAAADIVAMPSRAESFGIVYLEAWAYGKPVIGAGAGGAMDVIADGVDGYLVPFDAASELAKRICEVLIDRDRARHMGDAGRRKLLTRYTWDAIYEKTLAVYQDVAQVRT